MTIFDPATAQHILARLDRIQPDTRPLWGRMSAHQMVCHLTDACRVALGDTPTTLRSRVFSNRWIRWLIIAVLPIPRGKARTTREFTLTAPGEWARDMETFKVHFARVLTHGRDPAARWNTHPAFGDLNTALYGKLFAKHADHHLRQFGV